MNVLEEIKLVLRDTLKLGERARGLEASTPLFGSLPELDSMAVVTVVTALEDRFGIVIEDEEISADTFENVGSLASLVEHKLAA